MIKKIALICALACGALLQGQLSATTCGTEDWSSAGPNPYSWQAPNALGTWTMQSGNAVVDPSGPWGTHAVDWAGNLYTMNYNTPISGNNVGVTVTVGGPSNTGIFSVFLNANGLSGSGATYYKVIFITAPTGNTVRIQRVGSGGSSFLGIGSIGSLTGTHNLCILEVLSGGTAFFTVLVDGSTAVTGTDASPLTGTMVAITNAFANSRIGPVTLCY